MKSVAVAGQLKLGLWKVISYNRSGFAFDGVEPVVRSAVEFMLLNRLAVPFIARDGTPCFSRFPQLKCRRPTNEAKEFGKLRAVLTQRASIPLQGVTGAFTQAVG